MGWLGGIGLLFFLWAIFEHNWRKENEDECQRLRNEIKSKQESVGHYFDESNKYYSLYKDALERYIKLCVSTTSLQGLHEDCNEEIIADLILKHDDYTKIKSASDVDLSNFEKTIKIALCAEKGLLDWYQDLSSDKLKRKTFSGRYVAINEDQINMLNAGKYDFVLDKIKMEELINSFRSNK
jgi:hypothetical protein